VKSTNFKMHRPRSLREIIELLEVHGEDARILAGGQTLLPMLAMRVASPAHLIDISLAKELHEFNVTGKSLRVGAGVTQTALEGWDQLSQYQPLLKMMFPWIAHSPIRNRGTVCGSIAHADPSAEMVLAIMTLEGFVTLGSKKKVRIVKAEDFFVGALQTIRESNELILSVDFPIQSTKVGYGFSEYGYRHGDFAVVAVAIIRNGNLWRIGFGGIDDTAKVFHVEANSVSEVEEYIHTLASTIEVREDPTATSGLRRHLMRTLGKRAATQAFEYESDLQL
jgi:2-furoyl-CoA dehydrogenase FAD binding subunit